jgi:hypothetical protein
MEEPFSLDLRIEECLGPAVGHESQPFGGGRLQMLQRKRLPRFAAYFAMPVCTFIIGVNTSNRRVKRCELVY